MKMFFFITLQLFFTSLLSAQHYIKYHNQGIDYFNKTYYFTAYQRFELAKQFASNENEKKTVNTWMSRVSDSLNKPRLLPVSTDGSNARVNTGNNNELLALIEKGDFYLKNRYYSEASKRYMDALKLDKNNIDVLEKLGQCQSNLDEYKGAYDTYRNLIGLDSSYYGYYWNYSYFALFNSDYTGAIKAGKTSLALENQKKMVYSYIALAYILLNQYNKAKLIYKNYRFQRLDGYTNPAGELFYNHILRLEKAGINHPDFEQAKIYVNPFK